jgi:hypothetical protein
MIERDYIMRMIQMLVQALARIVFLKKAREYPEALNEIQKASKTLIGVELDVIRKLSDIQIIDLLSLDVSLGIPKCHTAGMLLKEEAEILEIQEKNAESTDAYAKSVSLLTETAIHSKVPFDTDYAEAIDFAAGKLKGIDIPVYINKKLFHYYETAREYAKAEDILFEVIEKEPSFIEEGIHYYEKLKEKSDEELSDGNFSRKEIEEGMNELRGRKKTA